MRELAASISGGEEPSVVSVAFPGPISPQGIALSAPTVWGESSEPFQVGPEIEKLWPSAIVFVMNDVTAAGYRYLRDPSEDFCIVTVSSGIGLKVFVGGRPVLGPAGRGGEIGHVRVDFSTDPPVCDCGGPGHLGAISSGRGALLAAWRSAEADRDDFANSLLAGTGKALDNPTLVSAFHHGDDWACRLIRRTTHPLGQMLAVIHVSLGLERFIIIGGFALALGEAYRRELVEAASSCCWRLGQSWDSMITLGEPDDLTGVLGAARFAREQLGREP